MSAYRAGIGRRSRQWQARVAAGPVRAAGVLRHLAYPLLAAALGGSALALAGLGQASAASPYSLVAAVSHVQYTTVPAPPGPATNIYQAVGAADQRAGHQGWGLAMVNNTVGLEVPDPAITVSSGWDASLFPGLVASTTACPNGVVTRQGDAFPYTWTEPSLAGQTADDPMDCYILGPGLPDMSENGPHTSAMIVQDLWQGNWGNGAGDANPNAPLSFQPGFDSFRSVDTSTLAPGGIQHLTFGLTSRDASINELGARFLAFMSPLTFTSATPPAGVAVCPVPDPGTAPCLAFPIQAVPGGKVLGMDIMHPVPGQEYVLRGTATNEGSVPLDMIPPMDTWAMPQTANLAATGTGVQVTEPRLDGPAPGSGSIGFSVGAAAGWTVQTSQTVQVFYQGQQTYPSAPVITSVSLPANGTVVAANTPVPLSAQFADAAGGAHTCTVTWGDATTTTVSASPDGTTGTCALTHAYPAGGVYDAAVTATGAQGSTSAPWTVQIVAYDPSAGFVTGGGWITSPAGAYAPDPALTGKATFGFESRYKKGATVPAGQTEFQFQAAGLTFHSDSYQWLVVAGARVQYKATGSLNGTQGYGFMLTALDANLQPAGGTDGLRIKITDPSGAVIYDNVPGATDNIGAMPLTPLGGGQIIIHKS